MSNSLSLALDSIAKNLRQQKQQGYSAAEKWEKADLSYKMWDVQKKMAAVLESPGPLKKVLNCSRRIRKTSTALLKSMEFGLKKKNAQIRLVAPTREMLKDIIHPIMRILCEDAPRGMAPIWKYGRSLYEFPTNGSAFHIHGANNGHEDDSRGNASDLCIVDEAQKVDRLKYLIKDVLMPQLINEDANQIGKLWVLFTPPKTPLHYVVQLAQEAKLREAYAEYNIYDSEYPEEVIEIFEKEAGGKESTTWQREYMCQFVVDENYSIIPEWNDSYEQEYEKDDLYEFYHKYVSMDIGVRDFTADIFGVYDFKNARIAVLDEFVMNGAEMTTDKLALQIRAKEKELWDRMPVKKRISDNDNLILIQDLGKLHNLYFVPTRKDTLEAMVNKIRMWVKSGRIWVSPKCKQLLGCLKYGVWNTKRTDFERSETLGHFDALAALIYMVRNIDETTNPIPSNYGVDVKNAFFRSQPGKEMSQNVQTIRDVLLPRRR